MSGQWSVISKSRPTDHCSLIHELVPTCDVISGVMSSRKRLIVFLPFLLLCAVREE